MARQIDRLPAPKEARPTKVVVLSRSRKQVFATESSTNMRVFEEALRSKYLDDSSKPYGKAEFDKWFAEYDAIMTAPQYFFDEFLEFYPDAKFIITDRDADSWIKSVKSTICELLRMVNSFPLSILRKTDPWLSAFCTLNCTLEEIIFHGKGSVAGIEDAKSDFVARQQQIQKLSSRPNVAVFRLEDGFSWEKLCPFLGHDIPSTPYPNAYGQSDFHARWAKVLRPKMWYASLTILSALLIPTLSIWACYFA
ncbi:hypothetical protein ACRE_087440 [Hapsidospora chrysogenum ATCC 11550]|uniref:Uncharacterized protein n=1 Tax=Hapsidospora chrysogenum (strain ATCC 11550 / CBS 779.69 / DSM 880 / IAM 14645 / JCM 23072 / IMI 49137) TaxID=857340 RepID=A0A086STX0_HAPC1|nr:hypothetical protein ACRE_087440 [Hapsidospora chrysogenum ATCC 11550]